MKTTLLFLSVFFILSQSLLSQNNTWTHAVFNNTDHGYNNSFDLANGKSFIHTDRYDPPNAYPYAAIIDSTGQEIVSIYPDIINNVGPRWFGINDILYSCRYDNTIQQTLIVKHNTELDTLDTYYKDYPFQKMHKVDNNQIVLIGEFQVELVDVNFNEIWTRSGWPSELPAYDDVEVYGFPINSYDNESNQIVSYRGYEHFDMQNGNILDTSTIDIVRYNINDGTVIDSVRMDLDYNCPYVESEDLLFSNNKIIVPYWRYDSQYQVFRGISIIDENYNIQDLIYGMDDENGNVSGDGTSRRFFQGFNNQLFYYYPTFFSQNAGGDTLYSCDLELNILNQWKPFDNEYQILDVDTVSGGYIFEINDLTENRLKFIRTDFNYNYNTCAGNNTLFEDPFEICLVTVENDLNKVIWQEESNTGNISGYNVYRESTSNSYEFLDFVDIDSLSEYVDLSSTPSTFPHRYKLSYVDSCLRESPLTVSFHETIHLTSNLGTNDEVNLLWNLYTGTSYNTHYIYRGADAQSMELIDSVSSSVTSYTDFNAPTSGSLYYQISITPGSQCTSTKATYSGILSNTKSAYGTVSLEEGFINQNRLLIKIVDMMGRETSFKPNTSLIYVYDDGSTEKVFTIE